MADLVVVQPSPGARALNPAAQGPIQDRATGSGTAEKRARTPSAPPKPAGHKGPKKGPKCCPASGAGLALEVADSADERNASETPDAEASNETSGNDNDLTYNTLMGRSSSTAPIVG
uniref:Uncharacterized protein n=1 Tax=Sphaerodactylus townsendi TaxID=933632 RepID=A0ACB8ED45_9SAUR